MAKSNQEDAVLLEEEKNLDAFRLLCNWGVRQRHRLLHMDSWVQDNRKIWHGWVLPEYLLGQLPLHVIFSLPCLAYPPLSQT